MWIKERRLHVKGNKVSYLFLFHFQSCSHWIYAYFFMKALLWHTAHTQSKGTKFQCVGGFKGLLGSTYPRDAPEHEYYQCSLCLYFHIYIKKKKYFSILQQCLMVKSFFKHSMNECIWKDVLKCIFNSFLSISSRVWTKSPISGWKKNLLFKTQSNNVAKLSRSTGLSG